MKLFRLTAKTDSVFVNKKNRTFFVSMATKEEAKEYLEKHLHATWYISSVVCVADTQHAWIMWSKS